MKYTIKIVLYYASFTAITVLCLQMLGSTLLLTVFNAILDEFRGIYATNICVHILLPIITAALTYVLKAKDSEARREYLKSSEGIEYDIKQDTKNVLKSREYIIECSVFALIFVFLAAVGAPPLPLYLVFSVGFAAFDLFAWRHIHKKWHSERLRK